MLRGLKFRLGKLTPRLSPPPYEPDVVAAIKRCVFPGPICADVGAHVGAITRVLAAASGPAGSVTAFEAYPTNADDLRHALSAEGLGWVTVENLAITDGSERTVWLHPDWDGLTAEWNLVAHDVDGRRTPAHIEVRASSLDDYVPAGAPLDFVKIDVEGVEDRVLAGTRRLLREARPVVLTEFHDDAGWEGRRHLLDAGYRLETLDGEPVGPDASRIYHCPARPK